jgi:nucleoside phosphorylase
MYDPKDYTVGWICALPTEYVAAQEFLDDEHDRPELPIHSKNHYALGRMGKHNVAIATLPLGEYGIASAARVAYEMLHCFPNIRIGLMVGVGGGVPTRHDVRLGDIVVSTPRNGLGGVLQYDFGKTIQGRSFQLTGFLGQPPAILRNALAGLLTHYERKGHNIEQAVEDVITKNRRLRSKYKKPDPVSDRLFQSDHTSKDGDDPSFLVQRKERDKDMDNPMIHYGLIASANQLMKDALIRDRLAREKDILCFEMEAAGLMNDFPCLVIRGICDYSDSHKTKEWQGYAAMVAAAYAKDLLSQIAPQQVEKEKKLSDVLTTG